MKGHGNVNVTSRISYNVRFEKRTKTTVQQSPNHAIENSLSSINGFVKWPKIAGFLHKKAYKNIFCKKTDFLHKRAAFLQKIYSVKKLLFYKSIFL